MTAIGLGILKMLSNSSCIGCDISSTAVGLSRRNAARLGLSGRYQCIQSSAAQFSQNMAMAQTSNFPAQFDLIVANPPYILQEDMLALPPEVGVYEDHRALCGGIEGFDVIEEILTSAGGLLRPDGSRQVLLEVDSKHPNMLQAWIEKKGLDVQVVECRDDLYGRPRFCRLQID